MQPMKFGVGQPVLRKEDDALVRGKGHYLGAYAPAGLLHATVLRSPHAHARFRITDLAAARAKPGVHLVLTGDALADLGPLPCQIELPDTKIAVPPYPVLAREVARHVGDAIAFVVADTIEQARDAAEAITIEWTPLPHVTDAATALAPGAPKVWADRTGNLCFENTIGDKAKTDQAFASAAHVVELTVLNQRLVANYLDTRGVIGECDEGGRITLTLSSQGGHAMRDVLCNNVLRIPSERLRVVTPDVGG